MLIAVKGPISPFGDPQEPQGLPKGHFTASIGEAVLLLIVTARGKSERKGFHINLKH